MRLIEGLADSMSAGRHQPLLEVEPLANQPDRYQIVIGEQRWRAARRAGAQTIEARILPPLTYVDRLRKQWEENRLRAGLDPVEEAAAILRFKILADIAAAEGLLREAGVPCQSLEAKSITEREAFESHLGELKELLVAREIHVVRTAGGPVCGLLTLWRETEHALGISEAARKQKVGILRLPADLQDQVRELPAEHAIQISRLEDREQQEGLVQRGSQLTHLQVRAAVNRLRQNPELTVDQALKQDQPPSSEGEGLTAAGHAGDPLEFHTQLAALADVGRQLVRRLGYLRRLRLTDEERDQVRDLLADLRRATQEF
jgi:Spy/CpxP family protein refolding chaperone